VLWNSQYWYPCSNLVSLTSITPGQRRSSPWSSTRNVFHLLDKLALISDGHKDDALMGEERQGGGHRGFWNRSGRIDQRIQTLLTLSTVLGPGRRDDGSHLPVERLSSPEATSRVKEGGGLSDSATIAGRDCKILVRTNASSKRCLSHMQK
jgi:hypothetical protein